METDGLFTCRTHGLNVYFDTASEQQVLSIQLTLQVALPHLMQKVFESAPRAAAERATDGSITAGAGAPPAACAVNCQFGLGGPGDRGPLAPGIMPVGPAPGMASGVHGFPTSSSLGSAWPGGPPRGVAQVHRWAAPALEPPLPALPSLLPPLPGRMLAGAPRMPPSPPSDGAAASSSAALPRGRREASPTPPPATRLARLAAGKQAKELPSSAPAEASTDTLDIPRPLFAGHSASRASASGASGPSALAAQLLAALRAGDSGEALSLLQRQADVNCLDGDASRTSPLFHVLESGANVEHAWMLIMARADVNFVNPRGDTPLHFALRNCNTLCPLILRMLLHAQTDINKEDAGGKTALQAIPLTMKDLQGPDPINSNIRQFLSEFTDHPTIDIVVLAGHVPILSAAFADTRNDRIVFATASSVGIYSVEQRRIVSVKKLRDTKALSSVKCVSVNPASGTLAVCLELWQGKSHETIIIIWPSGDLQDEEPIKLSVDVDTEHTKLQQMPAQVLLSRTRGPQMILGRLAEGKAFSWLLDLSRIELKNETELADLVVNMAVSDDGRWIAVKCEQSSSTVLKVFSYESKSGLLAEPTQVWAQGRAPEAMAIQRHSSPDPSALPQAHLALTYAADAGGVVPPIDILAVSVEGASSLLYRLKVPSLCVRLSFCHLVTSHLVSCHEDGLTVLYDLQHSSTVQCHCDPNSWSFSLSSDRTLGVAAEFGCLRVFRMPSFASQEARITL